MGSLITVLYIMIYITLLAYSLRSVQGETESKRERKASNVNSSQGALSNRSHSSPTLSPFCSVPGYHQTPEEGLPSLGTLPWDLQL